VARRKEHTHEQIRHMAISAVVEHLQSHGVDNLSLRKVATTIGYVPSTLINIFGSYQYLLLAVSEQTLLQLAAQLQLIKPTTPKQTIEQMAIVYSQFALANRRCFRLVFELTMTDDQPLPAAHLRLIKSLFSDVESQLSQYFPSACEQEVEMMSRVLWGGIHGLTCLSLDGKLFETQSCLQDMLTSHVSSYIDGMSIKRNSNAAN
jgi:AcrR family transcriptional regulator